MRKHLHRILSLLCVLALAVGAVAALAQEDTEETEVRIISVKWEDGDNYDKTRPAEVKVQLADQWATMTEANGWTDMVVVPKSTPLDAWICPLAEDIGYDQMTPNFRRETSVITYIRNNMSHDDLYTSVSAQVAWDDNDNSAGIRPESVQIQLVEGDAQNPFGKPKTAKKDAWSATWDDMPKRKPGESESISYSVKPVQVPANYTATVDGLKVTFTLQTTSLTVNASVTGLPDDVDLSGVTVTVKGPDPSMPQELPLGTHDLGNVIPGTYLVYSNNADGLSEEYTMDTANSKITDGLYANPGESATLNFVYAYKPIEDPEEGVPDSDYDPKANIGSLTFDIYGPDPRMPILGLKLSDFDKVSENKYSYSKLNDLAPGTYTIVERNAEKLIDYYILTGNSVTGAIINVTPDESVTANLFNQYVPAPTPVPEPEYVDIPVTKTWNDTDDKDGNRPESITVRLYADGVEVDSHVLTAAENWSYTFTGRPRYQEDNRTEIAYTVNEDAVRLYDRKINGYNIVNDYRPEVTSVSVSKVWADNNNEKNIRPTSIFMSLSDGTKIVKRVILNSGNGWFATVDNLPTEVNGKPAVYTWKEQTVLGYRQSNMTEKDGLTTFVNAPRKRPDTPEQGKKPKTPGETVEIDEYDTPLGVEIIINHVGDCFD